MKHEKKESKVQEKKEHMAKAFASGRGTKKEVMEKLDKAAKAEKK